LGKRPFPGEAVSSLEEVPVLVAGPGAVPVTAVPAKGAGRQPTLAAKVSAGDLMRSFMLAS